MSRPAPSAPSMADAGTTDAVGGHRRGAVAPQAQPVEPPGRPRRRRRRAGHQPQRHRPVGRQRPARPDVAVGLAGRGDPALRASRRTPSPSRGRACSTGAQKWLREPDLGERQRGQVLAGGDRARGRPRGPWASMHRGRGVVHQHHHRRRAARRGRGARRPRRRRRAVPPPPPTSAALSRPRRPAAARASTSARGKAPVRSTSAAAGATVVSTTPPTASTTSDRWGTAETATRAPPWDRGRTITADLGARP